MRFLTWNILNGGGKRRKEIAESIVNSGCDVAVLTEYRGDEIIPGMLQEAGFRWRARAWEELKVQSILIASRLEMTPRACSAEQLRCKEQWLEACLLGAGLHVLGVNVPDADSRRPDRKDLKEHFWTHVLNFADRHKEAKALIVGDTNIGSNEWDRTGGQRFRCATKFQDLLELGWIDAWREHNGDSREYSWCSSKNGFRIDQCFLSPPLGKSLLTAHMKHDVRMEGLSDHSALVVDIDDNVCHETS